jgi:O-antigen/teichoic acid export membrane protein
MDATRPPSPSSGRADTARAGGMAAATMGQNVIALIFTVAFAHLLGHGGYGSLSALIAAFLIVSLPGTALQVAAARATALGRLGHGPELAGTVASWVRELVLAAVVLAVLAGLARQQLADVIGVKQTWAAAVTLPTACIWLALSLERGVLQGIGAYVPVGLSLLLEAGGRLVFGVSITLAGGGVTGAFLGTPLSQLAAAGVLGYVLVRRLGRPAQAHPAWGLRSLVSRSWAPLIGITLLAILQNVDVIVVKHRASGDTVDSYAAAAVAAKAIVWLAIGVALYLVPEAARRAHRGEDARPLLARSAILILLAAVPMVGVYAVGGHLLLSTVFGARLTRSAAALPWLGLAFSLFAVSYLIVQFMLALGHARFLALLALGALADPIAVLLVPNRLVDIARALVVVQLGLLIGLALIARVTRASATPTVQNSPSWLAESAPLETTGV